MISVYLMTFNEEHLINFTINWWRVRFPKCDITLYDNMSTDRTATIALSNGCKVKYYSTKGKMDEEILSFMKNSCWLDSKYDWVFVGDCDEMVNITEEQLKRETELGVTVLDSLVYQMINKYRVPLYEMSHARIYKKGTHKRLIFNRQYIVATNYNVGSHRAELVGNIKFSAAKYPIFHYKYVDFTSVWLRHQMYQSRQPAISIENNWAEHYRYSKLRYWWEWKKLCWKSVRVK